MDAVKKGVYEFSSVSVLNNIVFYLGAVLAFYDK